MRTRHRLKISTALLIPLAMAACADRIADPGGTGGGGPTPAPTPAPIASIQSRIGGNFLAFFTAAETSDPRDPAASDLPAVNATADPLDN